jgi:hypothetical protein
MVSPYPACRAIQGIVNMAEKHAGVRTESRWLWESSCQDSGAKYALLETWSWRPDVVEIKSSWPMPRSRCAIEMIGCACDVDALGVKR